MLSILVFFQATAGPAVMTAPNLVRLRLGLYHNACSQAPLHPVCRFPWGLGTGDGGEGIQSPREPCEKLRFRNANPHQKCDSQG